MAGQDAEKKFVGYWVLEFLEQEFKNSATSADSKESLEVAMQCLETAFSINLKEEKYKSRKSLLEVYREYASGKSPPAKEKSVEQIIKESGFDNVNAVHLEFGPDYELPPESSDDAKRQAEQRKNQGNEDMKNLQHHSALEHYTQAIALDGNNAVYFCNRAAAYLKLNMLDKALRDCQIAIQLEPEYARAYGRLGVVYSNLEDQTRAYICYYKAHEIEPANQSYLNNLRVAEEKMQGLGGSGAGDSAEGAGSAQSPFGGAGGAPPNLQSLFNNPSLMNMATQMLQDPNMQNMMRNIIGSFNGGNEAQGTDNFVQIGQAIANQIRESNPGLAEEMNARLTNQEPRQSPQEDSYDL